LLIKSLNIEQLINLYDYNVSRLVMDLGDVREVAVVKINGTPVDTLWKLPCATPVSKYLKAGVNQLGIEVTNLWHNRLVGDAGKPDA